MSRRFRVASVTLDGLSALLANRAETINVPPDAKVTAAQVDLVTDSVLLQIESAAFSEVREGYHAERMSVLAIKREPDINLI